MRTTGIGGSIGLIALGAILAWAVTVETEGFNINTAGIILLVVGIVGLIATIAMSSQAEKTVIERDNTVVSDRVESR